MALNIRAGKEEVEISVSDSGPGIPKAMLKTIFERFWQIGKSDRRGLGLYISKMLIEAQHGSIWGESEVGKGSTFHIILPATGIDTP